MQVAIRRQRPKPTAKGRGQDVRPMAEGRLRAVGLGAAEVGSGRAVARVGDAKGLNYILYPLTNPSCNRGIIHGVEVDAMGVVNEKINNLAEGI